MKTQSLKTKLLLSSFLVIFIFAFPILIMGSRVIQQEIFARAQNQVNTDLKIARSVFYGEIEAIKTAFNLIPLTVNFSDVRQKMGLDYLYVVDIQDKAKVKSELVQRAFLGQATGGIRNIGKDELMEIGEDVYQRSVIQIRPTPKSRRTSKTVQDKAMAIGYAMPVFDPASRVKSVIYGGKIINLDFPLVDKIRDLVFENKLYEGKPLGTVTIFLDDVRIATNVLDQQGNRAIGTLVSDTVYKKVIEDGQVWLDRAFVVTDWYLTSYEPIKNIKGKIIGILYVGILEKPFKDLEKRIFMGFLLIVGLATALAAVFSYLLAAAITRPATALLEATTKISDGNLQYRVNTKSQIKELDRLAESFNEMVKVIHERDTSLTISNEKLAALNKSYLDLVGFVSHELKGVLGSIIINIYSLKDGYLGALGPAQKKAVDSTARSLEHFENMVKNYLDLSRIEKNELELKKTMVALSKNIIIPAIENFERQSLEKKIRINNFVPEELKVCVDNSLMLIVSNNLLGNAIKYGSSAGVITIEAKDAGQDVQVSFYNDGTPILENERELLFKKFSRLPNAGQRKGTGLGLFITKEIVEKHGGKIWVQPQAHGNTFIFTLKKQ
ncbi:MAG: cache domain-containing protein [Candidatus Omnitrophota bacterium]